MDSAITIAKKYKNRFKIVTLDGQVINAGGSMTGGSKAQGVGMLSRSNEIDKLRASVKDLEDKKNNLAIQEKMLAEDLSSAIADLNGIEGDILSANEEKIRLEGEYKLAESEYDSSSGGVKELIEEERILNERIEKINADSITARETVEKLNNEIAEKEKSLEAVSGDRESLAVVREELSQKAEQIRLEMLGFEKDMQSADDNIRRLNILKGSHSNRLEELDAEIEAFKNKNIWLTKDIESLRASAEELRQKCDYAKTDVDDLLDARANLEKMRFRQLYGLPSDAEHARTPRQGISLGRPRREQGQGEPCRGRNDLLFGFWNGVGRYQTQARPLRGQGNRHCALGGRQPRR